MPSTPPRARASHRRLTAILAALIALSAAPLQALAVDPPPTEASDEIARDPDLETGRHLHADGEVHDHGPRQGDVGPLTDRQLAALGLRRGDGACRGLYEHRADRAAQLGGSPPCLHGPDVMLPTALDAAGRSAAALPPAPSGWSMPTSIPCYSTGPYVEVYYVYRQGATNRMASLTERLRRQVAVANEVYRLSGSKKGEIRNVRWKMSGCRLVLQAVAVNGSPEEFGFVEYELRRRGILGAAEKGLAFSDAGTASSCWGLGTQYPNDTKTSTNPNNVGQSFGMVSGGCWLPERQAGFWPTVGGEVAAHELMHNLGGVQRSAPHATPNGHCWDDDPGYGADAMCYQDGYGGPWQPTCTPTLPELFDCGSNDYFHPKATSGNYLATHWNTADSRYLAKAAASGTDPLKKPTISWSSPASGGTVGGAAKARVSASVGGGVRITSYDWKVNGVATGAKSSELVVETRKTRSAGYANGTTLQFSVTVSDEDGLRTTSTRSAVVANPTVRLLTPTAFANASGSIAWSASAIAPGGRTIARSEILLDGAVKATDTTVPFGGSITAPAVNPSGFGPEAHTIQVRVTDSAGITRTSPARTIYVNPPVVSLGPGTEFGTGGEFSPFRVAPGTPVHLAAGAAAFPGSTVQSVQFRIGTTVIATDTTAPYTATWTMPAGTPLGTTTALTARAVDANGGAGTSSPMHVRAVAKRTTIATTAGLSEGATIAAPTEVTYTASTPASGALSSVCLYVDDLAAGCGFPGSETVTLDPAALTAGQHVAWWRASIWDETSGTSFELDGPFTRFSSTGAAAPTLALTGVPSRVSAKPTIGATLGALPEGWSVGEVRFQEGGRELGADLEAPYNVTWNTTAGADGQRTIAAVATGWDAQGRPWTRSATATTLVANFASWLIAPARNSTVSGTVTVTGLERLDPETAAENIAFFVDGSLKLIDRTSPFNYAWNTTTVSNGQHVLRVRTTLNDGRQLYSVDVPVNVDNP